MRERADAGAITLVPDRTSIDSDKMPLDPHFRVALALLERGDPQQVFDRTGVRLPGRLPVDERTV